MPGAPAELAQPKKEFANYKLINIKRLKNLLQKSASWRESINFISHQPPITKTVEAKISGQRDVFFYLVFVSLACISLTSPVFFCGELSREKLPRVWEAVVIS